MKKKNPIPKNFPLRSKDVFVTQNMLYAVRDELKDEIKSSTHGLKSEVHGLKSEIAKLSAEVHRAVALAEEQNTRNMAVIDSLTSLFGRQERVESRVDDVEATMASFRR